MPPTQFTWAWDFLLLAALQHNKENLPPGSKQIIQHDQHKKSSEEGAQKQHGLCEQKRQSFYDAL